MALDLPDKFLTIHYYYNFVLYISNSASCQNIEVTVDEIFNYKMY